MKMIKCSEFLSKLASDFINTEKIRAQILNEIFSMEELRGGINNFTIICHEELSLLVKLGSNIYAHAMVPSAKKLFLKVGLGFNIECSWNEVLKIIPCQIKL